MKPQSYFKRYAYYYEIFLMSTECISTASECYHKGIKIKNINIDAVLEDILFMHQVLRAAFPYIPSKTSNFMSALIFNNEGFVML